MIIEPSCICLVPGCPNRHRDDDAPLFQLMNVVVNFNSAYNGQKIDAKNGHSGIAGPYFRPATAVFVPITA
ncbi:hypothetical protein PCC82_23510 [Agrobacterium deltaense]